MKNSLFGLRTTGNSCLRCKCLEIRCLIHNNRYIYSVQNIESHSTTEQRERKIKFVLRSLTTATVFHSFTTVARSADYSRFSRSAGNNRRLIRLRRTVPLLLFRYETSAIINQKFLEAIVSLHPPTCQHYKQLDTVVYL